jgi:outer membrane protein assembly factor BamB
MSMKNGLILMISAAAMAADWTGFRGSNGAGISEDAPLPAELGPAANVAWRTATLKGNSSPVVASGQVYLTGHEGDERVVLCFDANSGALLWRRGVAKARTEVLHPINGPSTPTVATDGRMVYAFFPEYGILAYDSKGAEKWRVPLGPSASIQGLASSPVLAGGNLILLIDTPEEAFVVAFNAKSGRQAWKAERPIGFMGSYSTPTVYKPARGPEQVIVAASVELSSYQAATGERLWWARGVVAQPAALPVVSGGYVYTVEPKGEGAPPFSQMIKDTDKNQNGKVELTEVAGESVNDRIMYRVYKAIDKTYGNRDEIVTEEEYNKSFSRNNPGGGLVRTKLDGKGDVTQTHVGWRHAKGLPYVTAPILYGGLLYVVRNGGILQTFEPESGKPLGERRLGSALGEYYASPVAGDGKIYFANKEGKVTTIRAGADWEVTSQNEFNEQIIATPAIAGGRIYLRTEAALYCFAVPPKRSR